MAQYKLTLAIGSLALTALRPGASWAIPPSLPAAVPEDVVAAWFVDSASRESNLSSLDIARFVVDQAGELGLLSQVDPVSRGWIDTLAALSVALEYSHTVALFQVQARRLADGGHRLANLHGAMIAHTGGKNTALEERIQRLLNTYTNQEESSLRQIEAPSGTVFELRDRRLPDWALVSWGAVGDYYVVAIGEGSFSRVAETIGGRITNLADHPYYSRAAPGVQVDRAWFAVWTDFTRLEAASDEGLAGKIRRVRNVLGLQGVERGLWAARHEGRSVQVHGLAASGSGQQVRRLTTKTLAGVPCEELIPAGARSYAVLDASPRSVLGIIQEAYMAARSEKSQRSAQQYWRELQAAARVDVEREIFANLGQGVLIHDYPRHALNLPLLWTIAAPIRANPEEVRTATDRLFTAWQSQLEEAGAEVRLRRDSDGVWFLQIGINGPALGMTDRWMVMSFSPYGVRENLALLAGSPPPQHAGQGASDPR